jgi:hypothetical protein
MTTVRVSDCNPNSLDNPVCLSGQSYGTYCQHTLSKFPLKKRTIWTFMIVIAMWHHSWSNLTIAPAFGGIEYLQSHLHPRLLWLLPSGFHVSSSFGDNHSDGGHIHCNSSNGSAQVAALVAVCAGQNLSPLIHSFHRPCVHYLGDPGNATTRLG